jgi:hypothetical protein
MKHWHPDAFERGEGGPGSGDLREDRLPPGWWIVPGIFVGLFFWAAMFLVFSWAFD